jgi:hypothetical protein
MRTLVARRFNTITFYVRNTCIRKPETSYTFTHPTIDKCNPGETQAEKVARSPRKRW